MPSAAPSAWECMRCKRSSAAWLLPCLLALAGCSVYSEDMLLDDDDESSMDDDASGAGKTSGAGGKTSGAGGKTSGSSPGTGNGSMTGGTSSMSGGGTSGDVAGSAGEDPGVAGSSGSGNAEAGSSSVGGGGSGSAGSGGGGAPVTGAGDLIDGFEDADLTLEETGGRGGVWYLFNDGTVGKAGPAPLVCSPLASAPAALGGYGMHITSTGFTGWGSGLGVDFRAGKKVYDGSTFSGVRFWARVAEGKNTRHRLQLVDGTSDALGGKCDPAADAPNGTKCDDHFGINLTFTSAWTQYVVPFADLTQVGFGYPAPMIDKATLYGLQVTAKAKLEVDLWLDQIEFF